MGKKNIASCIAAALVFAAGVFTSAAKTGVISYAAENTETNFEKTDVLEDLQSMDGFSLSRYPFRDGGKPEVINVMEYCYSFYTNLRDNYGLYLYVYNPGALDIDENNYANRAQIAVKYDSDPVTEISEPTDYEKFGLQLCSVSTAPDTYRLFYKFKVLDHRSADGKTILERVNSMARRYDISGIELVTRGESTAHDYPLTGAHALSGNSNGYGSFTFSGFAKGYGPDENAESTLSFKVNKLETVTLDVKHTYYRTETSAQAGHQNQIDTVYFSVPKRLFDEYGKLQRIKAEWYEYKTKEILVTSNEEFYNAAHPYVGIELPFAYHNDDTGDYYYDEDLLWAFGTDPYVTTAPPALYETIYYWGTSWNMPWLKDVFQYTGASGGCKRLKTLYYMFPTKNWCDIKEYDPLSTEVEEIGGIKGNALYSYIKNYKTSFENGRLPIKDGTISADLFEDDIDETRKMDNERGKIQKGYSYYDFDADLDLQSWVGWGDEEHGFWENSSAYGFWNALFGKIPQEHGDVISPIQVLTKESEELKAADETLTTSLYINAADVAEFKQECTDAFTVSGIDDEEKYVVLFRFAVTDYKEENADICHSSNSLFGRSVERDINEAYLAQETVFLDFDVIQLSFLKGENWKIVPAVSDPTDIVNDITTPPYIPGTDKGLPMIVKVILIALVVLFAIVLISFVVKLFNGLSDLVNGNRRR